MKKFLSFSWEFIKMLVLSLAIILPVRAFLIQPFYVKGASMEPNFFDHEYLIVDEISYRFNEPTRGEIVVFRYPLNPQEFFIKRIIDLPGESIQFKDGRIYIYNLQNPQGFLLDEPYLDESLLTSASTDAKILLGANEYYLLDDNRMASKDSRIFGPVNKSFIIGKVFFRGLPVSRITTFKNVEYKY